VGAAVVVDARPEDCTLGRTARSQGWASAVERLRPGWAGTTLTGRYNGKRAAASAGGDLRPFFIFERGLDFLGNAV
jgi:hypothetical protein